MSVIIDNNSGSKQTDAAVQLTAHGLLTGGNELILNQ
jgi:hypothetical protein